MSLLLTSLECLMTSYSTRYEIYDSISPAEFFYRNKQMAGFSNPSQALYTTVRELVENSLDACEAAAVFPELQISIIRKTSDEIKVRVGDNGSGVPDEQVASAFGRVLYGSKFESRQRRGTFGLGVTMAVLYGQITTNQAVSIHTRTKNTLGQKYTLFIDIEANRPILDSKIQLKRRETGTTVSLSMVGDLARSKDRIIDYLRLTTVSSPHAMIKLNIDDGEPFIFGCYSSALPSIPLSTKPHPRSADTETIRRLVDENPGLKLRDFLMQSFQQVGRKGASQFLRFYGFEPSKVVSHLSRKQLTRISNALQQYDKFGRPDATCLSPIGKKNIQQSIKSLYNTDVVYYSSRVPAEWSGWPFIIEGALVIDKSLPAQDFPTLYRFANRVPLLYDTNDDILYRALKKISWSRYGLDSDHPTAIFVHFCSTRVPYNGAGKQSMASMPEIETEASLLFKELGRKMKRAISKHRNLQRDRSRMLRFEKSFKLVAKYSYQLAEIRKRPDTGDMITSLFRDDQDDN